MHAGADVNVNVVQYHFNHFSNNCHHGCHSSTCKTPMQKLGVFGCQRDGNVKPML